MENIIELQEYTPKLFLKDDLPLHIGELIWQNYSDQIDVYFPSPRTGNQWQLTSKGWVGHIPLSDDYRIVLSPKVEIGNLFRMFEYAYRLKSFLFLDGLLDCSSLPEFYERLANILSLRVLDRSRKGFYRSYEARNEILPYIRGRMNLQRLIKKPWAVDIRCHYEDHTSDIEDNQILYWTLSLIAKSGMCTQRVQPNVRRAFRSLQGMVSLNYQNSLDCIGRIYNRLNYDYEPLHALCRFFLDQTGPGHEVGDRPVLPFLVNMERLYELFVAEWLKKNLPQKLVIKSQEKLITGKNSSFQFDIDLVLYDAETNETLCVLDTKYKTPERISTHDRDQILAYALAKNCKEGILIYPKKLTDPIDDILGDIRVRTMTFNLDGNLDECGKKFIHELIRKKEKWLNEVE